MKLNRIVSDIKIIYQTLWNSWTISGDNKRYVIKEKMCTKNLIINQFIDERESVDSHNFPVVKYFQSPYPCCGDPLPWKECWLQCIML